MNSPHLDKQAMRQTFRRRRSALLSYFRVGAHAQIAGHLSHLLSERPSLRHIATYLASPDEVDLQPWVDMAWADGKEVYVPVLSETPGDMTFYPIQPQTPLRQGRFKLREPVLRASDTPIDHSVLDLALLPLLAFDAQGHRLGMGGGYYDRYFAETSRRPLIIGVGYDVQQAEHTLPTEPWDVHLDGVVTESGFRLFRS